MVVGSNPSGRVKAPYDCVGSFFISYKNKIKPLALIEQVNGLIFYSIVSLHTANWEVSKMEVR